MSAVAVAVEDDAVLIGRLPPPRWLLVVKGALWILVAVAVLSFSTTSVTTIGLMAGVAMILAGCDEMADGAVTRSWRWAHVALGLMFLVTGFLSLLAPLQTFGILAMFIGWYLMVKGIFDTAIAIALRDARPLWGLMLALGIGQVLIGVWALAYPGRSAWLLIAWVGFGALARGMGNLVGAFSGEAR